MNEERQAFRWGYWSLAFLGLFPLLLATIELLGPHSFFRKARLFFQLTPLPLLALLLGMSSRALSATVMRAEAITVRQATRLAKLRMAMVGSILLSLLALLWLAWLAIALNC